MADVKPKEDKVDQVDVISQSTDHLDRRKAVLCSPDTLDENKNWFSPPPLVFPSSTSCSCSASIKPPPSYDQVIQEKTLEGRIVRPTAAPRRSQSRADPIKEKSAGQKPQKPPRRSAPIPERLSEIDPGLERTESATDETPHPPSVSVWASEARPIPLPRTKSRKPRRDNVESLIRFEDDDVSMNGSSEDYPKEPLGVFNPSGDRAFSGEMSASNTQPNIYAKIQSFDIQSVSEDRIKPHPFPRKPPKPLPTAASFPDGQNAWRQDPTPTFPPRTPPKPASKPLRDELESLLSKGGPPHRSRPVLTRGDSTLEEPPLPPRPPAKPAKEPLKANLNANNHNSTGIFKENARPEPNPPPVLAPPRRRPTTIRVPSQIAPESPASKAPPPLPARKPVGSVDAARAGKQKPLPSLPAEAEPGYRPLPLPPNRQKDTAPTKVGPGRPPPPKATKGFVLPPRPLPGHQLYDKYAVPHGSAATDLNRNETGEVDFQAQSPASQREHGLTVQAMHDFTPEGPGELGLKSGDVVTAVERVDAEWYRGTCRGSAGYFPVNFVKVIPGLPKTVPQKKPKPPPSKVRASLDLDDEVSGWAMGDAGRSFPDNLPSNHPKSRTLPNRVTLPCSTCEFEVGDTKGRAMYDFNSKRDEELSFQVGDIITDLESLDDEWFLGDLRGKRALVPKNYIQIL